MTSEAAARLRRAADALRSGRKLPSADARLLADGFDAYLRGDASLEAALGIATDTYERRRQFVIELASTHYSGAISQRAKRIEEDAQRYAGTCWPRLRSLDAPPNHHVSSHEELLFHLHRNREAGGARWPLKRRVIFTILQKSALVLANVVDAKCDSNKGKGLP